MSDDRVCEGHHWIVYIDDFRQDEEFAVEEMTTLTSTRSDELRQLVDFYKVNGMPGTLDAERSPSTKSLGETVEGRLRRRDFPARYHADAPDLVTWAGSQASLAQQRRQVVQGNLNRLALQHRPLFWLLSAVWPRMPEGSASNRSWSNFDW